MEKHRQGHRNPIVRIVRGIATLPTRVALALIWAYKRLISPLLPPACRFSPTCSTYMARAITDHGFMRGATLGMKRVCKCHPFHPGGVDPVPGRELALDSRTENAR